MTVYHWTATGMKATGSIGSYVRQRDYDSLVETLRTVVDAYRERFGRGKNYVGPIDNEIVAAEKML